MLIFSDKQIWFPWVDSTTGYSNSLPSFSPPRNKSGRPSRRLRLSQVGHQYPSYPLTVKYRRQNRAMSSIIGIDFFSNSMEPPT